MIFVSEQNQRNYPCYFVVPQHPSGGRGWIGSLHYPSRYSYLVKEMVMELQNSHPNIDPDRIYVTGLSSGAWGAYQALSRFPYIYAAGLPVSEAIDTNFFTKENAKPMWILYDEKDKSSLVDDAKKLEAHLRGLGVRPRVTVFKSGGHNAWEAAYGKSGIINWLFR
jgi:predicted peptidase